MCINDFEMRRPRTPLEWLRIRLLYRRAFPRCERKPFGMILKMHRRGKTDVWYMETGRHFAGFACTINDSSLILLDYLAVPGKMRGRGAGSRALQALKQIYAGKGLFVEIESSFEAVPDQEERRRRRRFYLKNGMAPMGVMASVFDVKMELLGCGCHVDFPRYHAFYRDNYSAWAADHILEAEYPGNCK